ncbi:MAG TPA: ATP-binding protein [Vicinamibacterales bacterium]|nr:ATP-binding protein [Vicinamibacterales bacterium]
MAHLLENAAQYAPRGTSIDVSSEFAGTELLIRVRDHGAGLAAGDLPRVFDRFFRGRSAADVRASGTGMGLWIAKDRYVAQQAPVHRRDAGEQSLRDVYRRELPGRDERGHIRQT